MIERLRAPNPSLYTGPGTNTYLLRDSDEVLIVDPGPVIATHMADIVSAVGQDAVAGVVVTHTHPDHAPMANPLAQHFGVPAYGHGDGPQFIADISVADGDAISFGNSQISAVHTPGHTADHLCFVRGDVLLTGDHIMEGSTVILEDATDYLNSLYLVRDLNVARLEPGHGDGIDDAGAAIDEYIDHRLERERQIVDAVVAGAGTIGAIVDVVYTMVPSGLRHAAVHQVGVQLTKLSRDGLVLFDEGAGGETAKVRPR